jgi:beta-galactosidase
MGGGPVRRSLINDGWEFRPKGNRFAELTVPGAEWGAVTLPHDAIIGTQRSAAASPASGYFEGGIWEYRRPLLWAADGSDGAVILEFEGVYRDAAVYVNGSYAGHWSSGYSTFYVPIDHLLHRGVENEIRVEARAHHDSRWYTGGGIYRNVWILRGDRLHLAPGSLAVATPEIDDEVAAIAVAVTVRNQSTRSSTAELQVTIRDEGGQIVAEGGAPVTTQPGDDLVARHRLYVRRPSRWSLEAPTLYSCQVRLSEEGATDEEVTSFGIRSLSLDPHRGLRINGESVKLRGACVHHDNGVIGAATICRADERRVELLKAAGFNAIRSSHNPISTAMLDACDRVGMLVMDEAFDEWTESKSEDGYARRFDEWWERDIEAMVRRDFNHPSVVFYSIGNEILEAGKPMGARLGRAVAELVKRLDPTRYVTEAVSGMLVGGGELLAGFASSRKELGASPVLSAETGVNSAATTLWTVMSALMRSPVIGRNAEETYSYLDAGGYNYMESRFEIDRDLFPNRVMVASETYASSIDTGWPAALADPAVIGDFTWTGWDYLGEAGIGRTDYGDPETEASPRSFQGEYPWLAAWCGDFDITGNRRPQSYFREIVFGLRPDPYIVVERPHPVGQSVVHATPWSWDDVLPTWSWAVPDGTIFRVGVYSDGDEVELLLNGNSLGRQPAGVDHRYRARFDVPFEPGELEAVAWRDGKSGERSSLWSASGEVLLDMRMDRTVVVASTTDLAFIELTLIDSKGTVFMGADRRVVLQIDGPGVLQGFGSANPDNSASFTRSESETFNGRALAVIRPVQPGVVTVTAIADGCSPQSLELRVGPDLLMVGTAPSLL